MRALARTLLPPMAADALRRYLAPASHSGGDEIRFCGDFRSWQEAINASSGYAAPEILARTRVALLKVRDGEAAFERDSVVFDVMQFEFPLLAGLLRATTASGGRLSVLDFGGSLGSTYFQCRNFLSVATELRWSVVEQPTHVACGRSEFANDQLHFYPSIEECLPIEKPNVLLLSAVVQYLPDPYAFLADALQCGFEYVIVDRTAFMRNNRDRLTVQQVPASIYEASYPSWFLSETRFRACFGALYKLVYEFAGADNVQPDGGEAYFKGFQFQLKAGARQG